MSHLAAALLPLLRFEIENETETKTVFSEEKINNDFSPYFICSPYLDHMVQILCSGVMQY
jgi:hypothetical protein